MAILDYGSQTTQLIARQIREQGVYASLYHWDMPEEKIREFAPAALVLSGGPDSVYGENAPILPNWVLKSGLPILGICYGAQLLAYTLGGKIVGEGHREYGHADLTIRKTDNPLFAGIPPTTLPVWMNHGDRIEGVPAGFEIIGSTDNSPYAAFGNHQRRIYGVLFHPEVQHTAFGGALLHNFAVEISPIEPCWTTGLMVEQMVENVRQQVGDGQVVLGLSGGVDSLVAATVIHRAIGDQLTCIFVNNGLMRANEPEEVVTTFRAINGPNLIAVDATEKFLDALAGVTEPERKRKIIGELFVRVFEEESNKLRDVRFLAQGTIYPDVIESAAKERPGAHVIKTHHNVGGLPEDMKLELVEPLRYLFKDEVRRVGMELGLPEAMVWRQPFPGPGLAIRCLGEVTFERLEKLRAADLIFRQEMNKLGLLRETAQAYAALLPVKSVGVMGDQRTYAETIVLRAVTTDNFMTADWAKLPYELLGRVSSRIVNEVKGVNRVVYDVTTKPPATIEWE
ncbi:MAG: glutamine-hydrolyzing GMP synthase [Chloroflexi bacterium]|nr:glutamine-hydrolyzing GMP synthase [Chloroflexota bacterium]